MLQEWFDAFLLTQLVEAPLYAFLAFRGMTVGRRIALSLLPSAVTHPMVFLIFPLLPGPYDVVLLLAESFAVLAEGALLRFWAIPRPFAVSLLANSASVAVGALTRMLWGWP